MFLSKHRENEGKTIIFTQNQVLSTFDEIYFVFSAGLFMFYL